MVGADQAYSAAAVRRSGPASLLLLVSIASVLRSGLSVRPEHENAEFEATMKTEGVTITSDPNLWGQRKEAIPDICPDTELAVQHWREYTRGYNDELKPPTCVECTQIRNFVGFPDSLTWVRMQKGHPGSWKTAGFTHIVDGGELRGVPDDYQLPQSSPNMEGGRPYAIFLYPLVDPNGGFAMTERMCGRWACWRDHGYTVIVKRMRDAAQAEEFFSEFPDNSIGHLVLAGHGDRRSLLWSSDDGDINVESSGKTHDMLLTLRNKLTFDPTGQHSGTVFLDSCATAEGGGVFGTLFRLRSLFQYVANNLPGHKVTASDVSFSGKELEFYKPGEGRNTCEVKGVMQEGVNWQFEVVQQNHLKERITPPFCKDVPPLPWPSSWANEMSCLGPCRGSCPSAKSPAGTEIREAEGTFFQKRWESNCDVGWRPLCVIVSDE